jgi:hypothetical protein
VGAFFRVGTLAKRVREGKDLLITFTYGGMRAASWRAETTFERR